MSGRCQRCGGTGKVSYTVLGDLEPTPLGNGVSVQAMGGTGTRACACVRDLPPVIDRARWWESETVWQRVFTTFIHNDCVELDVVSEVPRREDGRRCVMRGNRYYPTLIEVHCPESMTLHSDSARELALTLLAAAEAADGVDDPCLTNWAGEPGG